MRNNLSAATHKVVLKCDKNRLQMPKHLYSESHREPHGPVSTWVVQPQNTTHLPIGVSRVFIAQTLVLCHRRPDEKEDNGSVVKAGLGGFGAVRHHHPY